MPGESLKHANREEVKNRMARVRRDQVIESQLRGQETYADLENMGRLDKRRDASSIAPS